MAVKNHALDQGIITAARAEFLEKGFRDASLHKIAERSGITTGALYTRYKNKDALFCSLVQTVLDEIQQKSASIEALYSNVQLSGDPEQILSAIRAEEEIYLDLFYRYSTECKLLFCRSDGSSLNRFMTDLMAKKVSSTTAYLKQICRHDLDLDGVEILLTGQFHFFRMLMEKDYSREKTLRCLKPIELYMEAGWKSLFEAIL